MEIKYTEEELNSIDKSLLIKMFLNLQNQMETLTVETKALNDKMQQMMEQLVIHYILHKLTYHKNVYFYIRQISFCLLIQNYFFEVLFEMQY